MSNNSDSHSYSAILVLDSSKTQIMKSSGIPITGWTRLYHAGPYHLDVNLRIEDRHLRLWGRVVNRLAHAVPQGLIRLRHTNRITGEIPLEASGHFSLLLDEPSKYSLEVKLGNDTVLLKGLEP